MLKFDEPVNILTVSATETVVTDLNEMFLKAGFSSPVHVDCVSHAKRTLVDTDFDLVIIDSPLPDEDATQLAIDLSKSQSFDFSIMMLTQVDLYEQNLYQAERMGIVTFKKPADPHLMLQTIRLLLSFRVQIKKLESKADKLQQKLDDIRLVDKAKFLLVERLKMSEQNAHYYIEKMAMDRCVKKTKIAKELIQMYENK